MDITHTSFVAGKDWLEQVMLMVSLSGMLLIMMSMVTGVGQALIVHRHIHDDHHGHQMGAGAEEAGITLQYCMSLPR